MKPFIYFTWLLTMLGCHIVRDRQTGRLYNQSADSKRSAMTWAVYDSAGYHWYFQSDSLLYYHPLKGLYSAGGRLSVTQEHMHRQEGRQSVDSTGYDRQERSDTMVSTARPSLGQLSWNTLLCGLVLVAVWLYFRPRRIS